MRIHIYIYTYIYTYTHIYIYINVFYCIGYAWPEFLEPSRKSGIYPTSSFATSEARADRVIEKQLHHNDQRHLEDSWCSGPP